MRAMSALMRDEGMSTRVCLAVTALRIRVSMSAIGSVIALSTFNLVSWRICELANAVQSPIHQFSKSPTALCHSCDIAFKRELAETQAAQGEFPHVRARPAAQAAAVAQPDLELGCLVFFRDLRCRCHKPF